MLERALAHGEIAQLVARLAARVPQEAAVSAAARQAAVAAVLRVTDAPELLLIKRAEHELDPWSGHMAFPGGRYEPGDASLAETAIRETREEVGLDLSAGHLLGQLDDLAPMTPSLPPLLIRPFVALVPPDVVVQPSDEVADTFWVPLAQLRAPASRIRYAHQVQGVVSHYPAFAVGPHAVWGLTERMLRQLLSLVETDGEDGS